MPRKIIPVPGVPPHEWHKHQPPCGEGESEQENMAAREKSVTVKTESVTPQKPHDSMKPKTRKVSMKQWEIGANDPVGYKDPPRCAPKVGAAAKYGGRLLYPHEAVVFAQSTSSPESAESFPRYSIDSQPREYENLSGIAKPQPLNAHHQAESSRVPAQHATKFEHVTAWRDFAANAASPESAGIQQHTHKDPVPTSVQRQSVINPGPRNGHDQPEKDPGLVQSAKQPEREKVYVVNPGPLVVHDGKWKGQETIHSDDAPETPAEGHRRGKLQVRNPGPRVADDQSDMGSEPVAPAPMRSPDLRAMQIPRPNRNYVGSARSMVSVLSLGDDDNARGDPYPERGDIRSKIGLEHNLHMSAGGKLINTDIWAERARQPREEIFLDPTYTNPWIEDYVENQIDYDVRANFVYEEDPIVHCHCDVDTFSGQLLKPVQYDYTVPDYMDSESVDRQMNRTASLYVARKAIKGNGRTNGRNNGRGVGPPRPPPWVDTPAPLSTTTPEPPALRPGQPAMRARADSDPDPFSPRVPCHLRPARMEDMEGVRDIYNWEVTNGLQALDTEPLSLADWERILKKTQDEKLPFVVVIRGAYQPQGKWSQYNTEQGQDAQSEAGKVLAFGFLTIREPGLTGSFNGTSRMSAKLHVFVHPGYRRKRLGHVCIDKLLSTVSTRYSTKLGYQFVDPGDNPTYKYPWQHERKFYSVFVEYFVPRIRDRFGPDEADLKWFERVMKSRYWFWNVARLEAVHRSRRTSSNEAAPIWLDSVIFEHRCQEGLGFTQTL